MPSYRKPYRGGLRFAPKNVKMAAVASGSTNWGAGTVIKKVGTNASTQYYGGQSGYDEVLMPSADIVSASDVATSGVAVSGSTYNILGVATRKALPNFLVWGNALNITETFSGSSAFENLNIGTYVTDETIWVCYSGTAPTVGGWVTLSSGTDGYVEAVSDPYDKIIIGQVLGISSGSVGPDHMGDSNIPVVLVDLTKKRGW